MVLIRIFRLTNAGDNDATEFIDFNIPGALTERTDIENAFITDIKDFDTDAVGSNQGVELPLGDLQALGKIEDVITVEGFFSKRNGDSNDGINVFETIMRGWADDEKITIDWDLGRFGLRVDDSISQSVIPDGAGVPANLTIALLWLKIEWTSDFTGNREKFKIFFKVNKGDGT